MTTDMTLKDNTKIRAVIRFCGNLGETPTQTYKLLHKSEQKCSRSLVFKWHGRFKDVHVAMTDDGRFGRTGSLKTKSVTLALSLLFDMHQLMALGNQVGRVFVWDIDVEDPVLAKCSVIQHNKCYSAVRQTCFSPDGETLLAVCDDGTIWRWDKIK